MSPQKHRLQLVWEIWWPCAAVGTFVLLAQRLLNLRDGNPLVTASSFLIFFVFSPWVIRRAVKLDFPGFNLVVIRHDGTKTRAMNYWESLSVNWLFTVRPLLWILALAIILLLVGKLLGMPNPFPPSEEPRFAISAILFHVIGRRLPSSSSLFGLLERPPGNNTVSLFSDWNGKPVYDAGSFVRPETKDRIVLYPRL